MEILAFLLSILTVSLGLPSHSIAADKQERLQYVVNSEGYADKLLEVLKRHLNDFYNNASLPDNVFSIHSQDDYYELSLLKGRVRRVERVEHSDALYEYGESHRVGMSVTLGRIVVQFHFSLREVDMPQEYQGTITQELANLKVGVVMAAYQGLDGQYVSALGDYKLEADGVVTSVELGFSAAGLPPPMVDQIVHAVRRNYNHNSAQRIGAGLRPYVAKSIHNIDFGDYIRKIPLLST